MFVVPSITSMATNDTTSRNPDLLSIPPFQLIIFIPTLYSIFCGSTTIIGLFVVAENKKKTIYVQFFLGTVFRYCLYLDLTTTVKNT